MARYPHLHEAVEDALRAPSVHNTQPWRWRLRPDTVELYADPDRHLATTDPDHRDLVLSCGAALHHLQVALAARGRAVRVQRLPDPEDSTLLATVTVLPPGEGTVDPVASDLYPAIAARHTDRRRMSHRPVRGDDLGTLRGQAARAGAVLVPVSEPDVRDRLLSVLTRAATVQRGEPGYAAELRLWTERLPGSHDGVPAANVPGAPVGAAGASPLRRFGRATLAQPATDPGRSPDDDASALLVLATPGDDVLDRLRAGEATSAVLLAATRLGLATTPLSQAIEVDATRRRIQTGVLHIPEHPQLVIRIGRPAAGAAEIPSTPRRELRAVLLPE
jgi:nitroreductase